MHSHADYTINLNGKDVCLSLRGEMYLIVLLSFVSLFTSLSCVGEDSLRDSGESCFIIKTSDETYKYRVNLSFESQYD